jgi:hypothetical protein
VWAHLGKWERQVYLHLSHIDNTAAQTSSLGGQAAAEVSFVTHSHLSSGSEGRNGTKWYLCTYPKWIVPDLAARWLPMNGLM